LPPPIRNRATHEEQDHNQKQPTPLHPVFLTHTGRRVERRERGWSDFLWPLSRCAIQWLRVGFAPPTKLKR
jgi:hypothetical protein